MPEVIPILGATTIERVKAISVEVDLTEEKMKDHSFGTRLVNGKSLLAALERQQRHSYR